MLTRALGISRVEQGQVSPDRLVRNRDAAYVPLAASMLDIYLQGIGLTREALHLRVERAACNILDAPPRRLAAFCKLLDDRSHFDVDRRGDAAKLRRFVFQFASKFHPLGVQADRLGGHSTLEVRKRLERVLQLSWDEIARRMYRDLPQNQRLLSFETFAAPADLLARYNVAQAQVALFDAIDMRIHASRDFKSILKYVKFAHLMHRVIAVEDGYLIAIDGPVSLLHKTRRYGVAMAKFLPGLLSCRNWSAVATIRKPGFGPLLWRLSSQSGLTSHVNRPSDFDSSLEEELFSAWHRSDTQGWRLERESIVLEQGQVIFVPDFVAVSPSGKRVLIELVGFWTPEYLAHKRAQLERFSTTPILIVLPERAQFSLPQLPAQSWFVYKSKIHVPALIARVTQLAE